MLWIRTGFNANPDPALYLDADPELESQTNANPCGSESWWNVAWQSPLCWNPDTGEPNLCGNMRIRIRSIVSNVKILIFTVYSRWLNISKRGADPHWFSRIRIKHSKNFFYPDPAYRPRGSTPLNCNLFCRGKFSFNCQHWVITWLRT